MRKYKLTDETITVERDGKEVTLHRIEALRDFAIVKAGDKGGFIENEKNLAHKGDCWIYGNAKVYGSAWIYGSAKVYGNAGICGSAKVYGSAEIYGYAGIYGNAEVYGIAKVCGDSVRGV